jgi:hypothetical protein
MKIVIVISLIVVAIISAIVLLLPYINKLSKPTNQKTQSDTIKESITSSITKEIPLGTSKDEIVSKLNIPKDKIGQNYAIDPTYNRIIDKDYLTTYIFNNNLLVAVVHEKILDNTEKQNLAIEFQQLSAKLNKAFPLISIKDDWTAPKKEYDNKTWNDSIIKNDLELTAEYSNNKEYVKVIASGINYFNFLVKDRQDSSLGNLVVVYTSASNKDNFNKLISLSSK